MRKEKFRYLNFKTIELLSKEQQKKVIGGYPAGGSCDRSCSCLSTDPKGVCGKNGDGSCNGTCKCTSSTGTPVGGYTLTDYNC